MRRLRMLLEYDGSGFAGFQRQPDQPTVQGELETRLSRIAGHPVTVTGAGRTDAGVHALGQVAHFDILGRIPADRVATAVNSQPGTGLLVRYVEEAPEGFHARYGAVSRTYRYHLDRELPHPLDARWTAHAPGLRADALERIRAALADLPGRHDFTSFCAAGAATASFERTVLRAEAWERGSRLAVEVTADAFLHHMVRILVGLLLEIGRGRQEPEALREALVRRDRSALPPMAPAHGLVLWHVDYPDGFGIDRRSSAPGYGLQDACPPETSP